MVNDMILLLCVSKYPTLLRYLDSGVTYRLSGKKKSYFYVLLNKKTGGRHSLPNGTRYTKWLFYPQGLKS